MRLVSILIQILIWRLRFKLRPYGGLISVDNSSLDKCFINLKISRLQAILHYASGFVFEYSEQGPGCSFVLPCPVTNECLCYATDIAFCMYVETFKTKIFQIVGMLTM